MAKERKRYVVRVVQTQTPEGTEVNEGGYISVAFIESLRYAGLITVHDTDPSGLTVHCFDLVCPSSIADSKAWSERNAERMRSFGFNAVSAPATR